MTPKDAVNHFGSQIKLANALKNCSQQAVSKWVAAGQIPALRQYEIQIVTDGALVADSHTQENESAELQETA